MKIGIIGMGKVGSSVAFGLLCLPKVKEIGIYDIKKNLLEGEYRDLGHASWFLRGKNIVQKKTMNSFNACDLIIITAGKPRLFVDIFDDELYRINKNIVKKILFTLRRNGCSIPLHKIWIVTNPVERLAREFGLLPCGPNLDRVREVTDKKDGKYILAKKGYTSWGITAEIMSRFV